MAGWLLRAKPYCQYNKADRISCPCSTSGVCTDYCDGFPDLEIAFGSGEQGAGLVMKSRAYMAVNTVTKTCDLTFFKGNDNLTYWDLGMPFYQGKTIYHDQGWGDMGFSGWSIDTKQTDQLTKVYKIPMPREAMSAALHLAAGAVSVLATVFASI